MSDFDAAVRVAKGAKLLDEKRPGWAKRLDLDTLKMEDCYSCILGQIYGSYHLGKSHCGIIVGYDHGFGEKFMKPDPEPEYAALRTAWLAEIAKRTKGGA